MEATLNAILEPGLSSTSSPPAAIPIPASTPEEVAVESFRRRPWWCFTRRYFRIIFSCSPMSRLTR